MAELLTDYISGYPFLVSRLCKLMDEDVAENQLNNPIYGAAVRDRNQFIREGHLDMRLVLEKFVQHFDEVYGDQEGTFYEEDGRRY